MKDTETTTKKMNSSFVSINVTWMGNKKLLEMQKYFQNYEDDVDAYSRMLREVTCRVVKTEPRDESEDPKGHDKVTVAQKIPLKSVSVNHYNWRFY